MQKELRLVKKDINAKLKEIRAGYRDAVGKVQPGVGTALVLGKGTARSVAAAGRRELRMRKEQAVQPYDEVKRVIDGILLELDKAKLEIQAWIDEQKAT